MKCWELTIGTKNTTFNTDAFLNEQTFNIKRSDKWRLY